MEPRTFIDLFAGIGGFHLAMQQEFGAECVFASDIDPDCQSVYERYFKMPVHGDIRQITEGPTNSIPDHDLLCAGFPCQPFSKSGHQRGINEARGTLFYDILRILQAKRPKYAVLENVRNLAGPRHRETWRTIISLLRDQGYRVADDPTIFSPHLLPREMHGAPQVRERVFILCERVDQDDPDPSDLTLPALVPNRPVDGWSPLGWDINDYLDDEADIPDLERYQLRPEEVKWLEVWNDLLQRLPDYERLPGFPIWADAFQATTALADGMPSWKVDFLIKNSQFYVQHREVIDSWLDRHDSLRGIPPSRRKLEWQAQDAPRDVFGLVIHLRPSGIRVKKGTYLPALVAITQTSIIGWRRRRITPSEAARLQGFPEDFVPHADDSVAYRQFGNAVNVGAVRHVARALVDHVAARKSRSHLKAAV